MKPLALGDASRALFGPSRGRPAALRLESDDIDVWGARLDEQPPDVIGTMATLLSADESRRARGFYFDRDRRRYVVGRGILRMLLGRYLGLPPEVVRFRYGANGKPSLEPDTAAEVTVHFNVAHSDGLVVYAFSRTGEVGIDVEFIREMPDWERVAQTAFSSVEFERLWNCPAERRMDEFFEAWTRQEALLKALGVGLGGAAAAEAEAAFKVISFQPAPGFAAALAAVPRGWKTRHHHWRHEDHFSLPGGADRAQPFRRIESRVSDTTLS
jgi:4'-phosphopantetheinyl transferase